MQSNETDEWNLGPRNVYIETSAVAYSNFANTAQVSCWKYISTMDWYVQNANTTSVITGTTGWKKQVKGNSQDFISNDVHKRQRRTHITVTNNV